MPSEEDVVNVDGITFPEDGNTQITIPSKVLLDEINKGQINKIRVLSQVTLAVH